MNKKSYKAVSGLARQFLNQNTGSIDYPWYISRYLNSNVRIDQLEIREFMIRHTPNWTNYLKRFPLRMRTRNERIRKNH